MVRAACGHIFIMPVIEANRIKGGFAYAHDMSGPTKSPQWMCAGLLCVDTAHTRL
jgi:hypothetical protein